jgi:hypothetical protein
LKPYRDPKPRRRLHLRSPSGRALHRRDAPRNSGSHQTHRWREVDSRHCGVAGHSRPLHRAEDWRENLAASVDADYDGHRRRSYLALKTNPPTPPLLREAGGMSKWGKGDVEAVSKCRSKVSKRRLAWASLRTRDVEAVEAGSRRLSKSVSKQCRSAPTSTTEPDLRVGGPIETAAIEGWRIVLKPGPPPAVDRPHCR